MATFLGIDVKRCVEVKYRASLDEIQDVASRDRYLSILMDAGRDFIDQKLSLAQIYYDQLTSGLSSLLTAATGATAACGAGSSLMPSGSTFAPALGVSQKGGLESTLSSCISSISSLESICSDLGISSLTSSSISGLKDRLSEINAALSLIPV